MKKNFLYSIVALCMCLFTACSQEEIIENADQGGKTVSLTVGVPGGTTTRALPSEKDCKLRCIMQIVDKDNKAIAGDGMRQVVEVKDVKITFTFKAPDGDYKCLFWADYVPSANTDMKTDNIYTTTDLTSITYKETDNDAFGTKADAFCGYIADGSTSITLKRPFAKVSVAPKNAATFIGYNNLTVSYDAPNSFNMVTGIASGTKKMTYTNTAFDATSEDNKKTWFTSFVFAPSNVEKLASPITMALSGGIGTPKNLTIPANKVPLTGNFEINGSFDVSESEGGNPDVNVDVDFDNEFDKPEVKPLAVGNYIYADGSHGTDATNAIGIVFATAAIDKDTPAAYESAFQSKEIAGYAIAISNVNSARQVINPAETTFPTLAATTATNGVAPTKALLEAVTYEATFFTTYKTWLTSNTLNASNMTNWYIPTVTQLSAFMGMILKFGDTPASGSNEFKAMTEFSNDKLFDRTPIATVYYASSSINDGGNISGVRLNTANEAFINATAAGITVKTSVQSALVRPMLTIFK